jgi:nitroreductase
MFRYEQQRSFLKSNFHEFKNNKTDKIKGLPKPPIVKGYGPLSKIIDLHRSEWKYDISAHKKILIDVGHVCQNLYLARESIGAVACAIGIYDQKLRRGLGFRRKRRIYPLSRSGWEEKIMLEFALVHIYLYFLNRFPVLT